MSASLKLTRSGRRSHREGVGHVVVATKSKHQTSCSVKYGLEASLKIGRNSHKYEVAVVEPGMHQRHHERTEAVTGDVLTQLAKLSNMGGGAKVTIDEDAQVMDSTDWFN